MAAQLSGWWFVPWFSWCRISHGVINLTDVALQSGMQPVMQLHEGCGNIQYVHISAQPAASISK
jgi:hypothetical protein